MQEFRTIQMARLNLELLIFNLYAQYIMWNARLDKAQAGIKHCWEKYQ